MQYIYKFCVGPLDLLLGTIYYGLEGAIGVNGSLLQLPEELAAAPAILASVLVAVLLWLPLMVLSYRNLHQFARLRRVLCCCIKRKPVADITAATTSSYSNSNSPSSREEQAEVGPGICSRWTKCLCRMKTVRVLVREAQQQTGFYRQVDVQSHGRYAAFTAALSKKLRKHSLSADKQWVVTQVVREDGVLVEDASDVACLVKDTKLIVTFQLQTKIRAQLKPAPSEKVLSKRQRQRLRKKQKQKNKQE